jgi:3-methylcrotonyl-CoA carboxylase alpha subunit
VAAARGLAARSCRWRRSSCTIRGHALEARIYAEDPAKGFLPSTGKLVHLAPPPRACTCGSTPAWKRATRSAPHYDPMIAKLIVWDINRDRALARMLQALADYRVVGVANNIEFLSRLTACPAFSGADLDTGLIEREKAGLRGNSMSVGRVGAVEFEPSHGLPNEG